jgi:hypothetical protein
MINIYLKNEWMIEKLYLFLKKKRESEVIDFTSSIVYLEYNDINWNFMIHIIVTRKWWWKTKIITNKI